jgi:lipopolysaccharide transport system ATP-binding protein
MKPIIEVTNLSKKYKYGESQPYYTLRDTLTGLVRAPFHLLNKKQKQINLNKNEFWALNNISFKVNRGEAMGIVGHNGAGKSTILKILSRITPPTKGKITLRGRVGSLLEVGTGFHFELTGRENIYLNGAILGMKRREIDKKFDEIVNFSGVEKFLDTPVKHYSSGMYMRLAFAVAANLDSEILIVDEVLAVGDTEFQKKCLGKMDEITKKEGRTILFVSHNMGAIKRLCGKGLLLDSGKKIYEGKIDNVVDQYMTSFDVKKVFEPIKVPEIDLVINKISINQKNNGKIVPGKPVQVDIDIFAEHEVKDIGIEIIFSHDDMDGRLFSTNTKSSDGLEIVIKKGNNHFTCFIDSFNLCSGKYRFGFSIQIPFIKSYYLNTDLFYFDVLETTFSNSQLPTLPMYGHVYLDHKWLIKT